MSGEEAAEGKIMAEDTERDGIEGRKEKQEEPTDRGGASKQDLIRFAKDA